MGVVEDSDGGREGNWLGLLGSGGGFLGKVCPLEGFVVGGEGK